MYSKQMKICGMSICSLNFALPTKTECLSSTLKSPRSSITRSVPKEIKPNVQDVSGCKGTSSEHCSCCSRRLFLGAALGTSSLPIPSSSASDKVLIPHDSMTMLNRVHPPRPDWYEEFYASAMDKMMATYEAEIAGYKSQLFANLKGKAEKILEIGIGTGPNLRYYAENSGIHVFGIDPNKKMERYAKAAAEVAGIPPSNFRFMQAVAEALPLDDASVDAVVGTLVLCSIQDVDLVLREIRRVLKPGGYYVFVEHVAAKDGTVLRLAQAILDPLQQMVADGCHLTRNTGTHIARAGFSHLDMNQVSLSNLSILSPHIYGTGRR